jgi:hypothetical protein
MKVTRCRKKMQHLINVWREAMALICHCYWNGSLEFKSFITNMCVKDWGLHSQKIDAKSFLNIS